MEGGAGDWGREGLGMRQVCNVSRASGLAVVCNMLAVVLNENIL